MNYRIIEKPEDIPITPMDIDTNRYLMSAFDNTETEDSAWWVVKLCQKLGGWLPFTIEQLQEFYTRPGRRPKEERFYFNRLVDAQMVRSNPWSDAVPRGGGWLVLKDGKYHVTDDFVWRCYRSSTAKR